MELNNDCLERIAKFSNRETVANLRMVSKDMYRISAKVSKFHQFHYAYMKSIKLYQVSKNKATTKKKKLYKIIDVIVKNQDFWRLLYHRGNKYEKYCRTIQKNLRLFFSLEYVPETRKKKYMCELSKWKEVMMKKYKIKEIILP